MEVSNNNNSYRDLRSLAAGICLALLALHIYYYCYQAFAAWGLTLPLIDRLTAGVARSGLFRHRAVSKVLALIALAGTTPGVPARTAARSKRQQYITLITGVLLYFGSDLLFQLDAIPATIATAYTLSMSAGLALLYTTIRSVAGFFHWKYADNIFNRYSESFPQEERLLKNPYSINIKARYTFRNQVRDSYINLVDIYRGTLVMGNPGSGKTRYIFRQMIQQSLANGMAVFVYDLKYDDLTRLTYNTLERLKKSRDPQRPGLTPPIQFYSVNFDDFNKSHRCNPLDPASLDDISDAADCAKTILFALNKNWINRQGDFFISSAIGFFTANIWFLRQYEDGRYCTLPHLLELMQCEYPKLFSVLQSFESIQTLISPFVSAFKNNVMEQLQGQVDSARMALSALASPHLYYLLSANDFTLDINNPHAPKAVCIGSNPQKQLILGAVISLYVSRMIKLVNKKGGVPCHLFYDEFSSFYASGMDVTLASARSNKVAITLGIQDLAQLRKEYGRDQADALFNLPGNIITSQVRGDSARLTSELFGKILQDKATVSINSRDSSTSQSQQLDLALPASKIAALSSGEFVGITADSPSQKITHKAFHNQVVIDHEAIEQEEATYQPVPDVNTVTRDTIEYTFRQIKADSRQLVEDRLAMMMQTPSLARLIVTKNKGLNRNRQAP